MDSSQSKLPNPGIEKAVEERLQAFEIDDRHQMQETDYVYVDRHSAQTMSKHPQTVSVDAVEEWKKTLLEDPKVR